MRFFFIVLSVMVMTSRWDNKGVSGTVWSVGEPEVSVRIEPLFIEKEQNDLVTVCFTAEGSEGSLALEKISLTFTDESTVTSLASIASWYTGVVPGAAKRTLAATSSVLAKNTDLTGEIILGPGKNIFVISFTAKADANLLSILQFERLKLTFSDGTAMCYDFPSTVTPVRFAKILRAAGQDASDTYRIPGLARTNTGTLVAVYDIRYLNGRDLQGDIDVGMSRSTDGGQTWEKMKVIMDMDEYAGKPEAENGIGDPCVLVDETTGTIWVAALWLNGFPGQVAWNASGSGLDPGVTGQFLLVRSDDDGVTWSEEINITSQVKDTTWRLLLQGPGNGITLEDGTIVFPAQFKDADGLPYSTIIHSTDQGTTWHIGTGAKRNTTEAQCVQLMDGNIMLNMRDNRNRKVNDNTNGRAVAISNDLGMTWQVHPSSNSALPEPVCMASVIATDIIIGGRPRRVLFFSNPNDKNNRSHMTVKASIDEGLTWPEKFWIELSEPSGYGYSCLTMVDENHVGILYEGIKELYFQKIPVTDFFDLK